MFKALLAAGLVALGAAGCTTAQTTTTAHYLPPASAQAAPVHVVPAVAYYAAPIEYVVAPAGPPAVTYPAMASGPVYASTPVMVAAPSHTFVAAPASPQRHCSELVVC